MDIELLGLTCVTGPENFLRFLSAASAFPAASLVLVTCWAFTTGWNTIFKRSKLQVAWRVMTRRFEVGSLCSVWGRVETFGDAGEAPNTSHEVLGEVCTVDGKI